MVLPQGRVFCSGALRIHYHLNQLSSLYVYQCSEFAADTLIRSDAQKSSMVTIKKVLLKYM